MESRPEPVVSEELGAAPDQCRPDSSAESGTALEAPPPSPELAKKTFDSLTDRVM